MIKMIWMHGVEDKKLCVLVENASLEVTTLN